jgi:hypothetical protein
MARWMSPDPSLLTHADRRNPQSLNLYTYVGNNPLSRVDLDGLCIKGFQWACNLGQSISNAVQGYGFHTDDTVDNNVENTRQNLRALGVSTEGWTYKQILQAATKPKRHEPDPTITYATDAFGLAGIFVKVPLGVSGAVATTNAINDRSNKSNAFFQLFGLWEPAATPMGITGAFADSIDYCSQNCTGSPTDTWKNDAPFLDSPEDHDGGLPPAERRTASIRFIRPACISCENACSSTGVQVCIFSPSRFAGAASKPAQ